MTSIVNLNQSHVVNNGYNNTLKRNLNTAGANFSGMEVAVDSILLNNSQFNITEEFGNNKFSLIIPTLATNTTLNITLKDGIYEYEDINNVIQQELYKLGAYYTDPNGDYVYNIQISKNVVYYSCQIDCSPTLVSFPVDWDTPSGLYLSSAPNTGWTPKIVIPEGFGKVVGLPVGTYPSTNQTTTQSFLSTVCPQINPVSSYVLRCNLVSNGYTQPSDLLTTFYTKGTLAGQTIDISVNSKTWVPISDGTRSYIELIIEDQEGRYVKFRDPQINISLVIRPIKSNSNN
jgi:hypothetical protein